MKINNQEYGAFMVSKNVVNGKLIRFTFREESNIPQLNGLNISSVDDDQDYINNADNFVLLSAESVYELSPRILELFYAPYGTDLCWLYDEHGFCGYHDLTQDKLVTLEEILNT